MKPIKLNYTNYNGKRTSTTISGQIALFWGMYHDLPPLGDDHPKKLTQAIQNHINKIDGALDKGSIENGLLQDVERKIIEQCERDQQQPNLF